MKAIILPFIALFVFLSHGLKSSAQAINTQDSLALLSLYDSTNGNSWTNHTNWKTMAPVSTWFGIGVTGSRVVSITMMGNHLTGGIPVEIGNLSALTTLILMDNELMGGLPSTIGNLTALVQLQIVARYLSGPLPTELGKLTNLKFLDLFSNQFSGKVPVSLTTLPNIETIDLSYNSFTFDGMEEMVQTYKNPGFFLYTPQNIIPIYNSGTKLSVQIGGTLARDTVRWYKSGSGLVATVIGDDSFTPSSAGVYHAEATNSIATELTLVSDSIAVGAILCDTTTTVVTNITDTIKKDITVGLLKLFTIAPAGVTHPLTGSTSCQVTVDTAVTVFNQQPYVERHFDITPAVNAATAEATVTLYFAQSEFDDYNDYVTSRHLILPLLPVNGVDNGNVRITQFHGDYTGSSSPGNYLSNSTVVITPLVVWDAINQWWAITFPVKGFSGFYVNTANVVLPVQLTHFTAVPAGKKVLLQWTTSGEKNIREFVVQHSVSTTFNTIGNLQPQAAASNSYRFTDEQPAAGNNYYRLKIIDDNGAVTYSEIIKIIFTETAGAIKIYPNPVASVLTVQITSAKTQNIVLVINDLSGKAVYKKNTSVNAGDNQKSFNVATLSAGTYFLITTVNGKQEKVQIIKK